MELQQTLAVRLRTSLAYFQGTASAFSEEDSAFAPDPAMFTVAAHVAHTADSVDWFVEGAFGKGWNLDFEALEARIRRVTSLGEAKEWLERSFADAVRAVEAATSDELLAPIPDERMMKGMPRAGVVNGIVDHTAHHRGSLAVYARALGKVPPMPYGG